MIARLIPFVLVIAAFALFFGYTQPTFGGSIASLQAEIESLDTALLAARQFKEKEVELTRERSEIPPEQLARLSAALPDSVDNVQLIVDLNSLAARSGVQLSEFDISGEETLGAATTGNIGAATAGTGDAGPMLALGGEEATESLELSVSATGSYAAFRTFLDGVEQSLRPLDIIELSVQDSPTGVYIYNVTFRIYWLR
ncbi:MAG: hypothetical protein V4644_03555 [Patescibacteria group bacterium]